MLTHPYTLDERKRGRRSAHPKQGSRQKIASTAPVDDDCNALDSAIRAL
jgi:hypothetical protein